jgi:hypothetical protein
VTPLDANTYHLRLIVQNTGWLPTNVSKKALNNKLVRGVIAEIELPEGASLKTGKRREELSQLAGRAYEPSAASPWGLSRVATDDRAKVEWVIHAPRDSTVKLIAHHDRAGVVRAEAKLK